MKLSKESKYFKVGLTALIVILISISFFFIVYRKDEVFQGLGVLVNIFMPFIYGLVMAYLISPLYNVFVRNFKKINWPKIRGKDRSLSMAKTLSSVITVVVILGILGAFLWLLIPQLVQSLVSIAGKLPNGITNLANWLQVSLDNFPKATGAMEGILRNFEDKFLGWVQDTIVPQYELVIKGVSSGILGFLNFIKNFFIGIIICVYFINRKEIMLAQCKKMLFAFVNKERAETFLKGATFTNNTFSGFISGKLLDAFIVGIICFIVMSIFGWPYATLISVIIGVTNIIPFFGPFIGAIPSAFLLLIYDPKVCLYFIIFIIILHQIDGNILGPKILSGKVGLSSFWVIFAILVGGGLFGFLGMIIGIPVFAVIYAYISYVVNKKLKKKGLSTEIEDYKGEDNYKPIKSRFVRRKEKPIEEDGSKED